MSSLHALLAQLPADNHGKGKTFEKLAKWFLENAAEYKAVIKKVHHWSSSPHRWGRDTGIDLTAEGHDGKLWAIQAKAYDPDNYVTKQDIDKFLSESARQPIGRRAFDWRLLIATTDRLGPNAKNVLADTPGARLLLRSDLEKASITWPRSFEALAPAKTPPWKPEPHQRVAINDVLRGFRRGARGQLLMACGTGKTLTGLWTTEALKAKRVLVLVPSLALVRQTLRSWYANGTHKPPYLVVCSDESVQKGEDGDQLVLTTQDLPYPVTTDSKEIAAFLSQAGRRYIFSTYHSSPQLAKAFSERPTLPQFDLIIADEAHRLAGASDADYATVLDGDRIKSKRRLFMTATPRFASGRLLQDSKQVGIEVASMDDTRLFGPVFHKLTFGAAIRRKLLTDYQVAIVIVDDETPRQQAETGAFVTLNGKTVDARTLACQLGLARAMKRFDLRKVVSFHSRVKWAAAFASSFPATVELMPRAIRPGGNLWCRHVSGAQPTRDRDTELTALKELDGNTRGLIANARCLTEGVDVPTLDGVAFIDPRRSEVDVVQAVGRAIRKSKDKRIGTIIVPVFVGRRSSAIDALESSAFSPVWQVIQALRAHDDMLASQLDELRREMGRRGTVGKLPAKLKVIGAAEVSAEFLAAFDARLVERVTETWHFWYGLLLEFVREHGHAHPRQSHVTRGGYSLGAWVNGQRALAKKSLLASERVRLLESLPGWSWQARIDKWERAFLLLQQYVSEHGDAKVPGTHKTPDGVRLGGWVITQRDAYNNGVLSSDRQTRLESLRGWSWNAVVDAWEDGFAELRRFATAEGTAKVPFAHITKSGFPLGSWVNVQRNFARQGKLSLDRRSRLESLPGWAWNALADAWEDGFRHLEQFAAEEGHARVPMAYVAKDRFKLGRWVSIQRRVKSQGKLDHDRERRLETVNGWTWNVVDVGWDAGLRHLKEFCTREGNARVPQTFVTHDHFRLGIWVNRQRGAKRAGELTRERQKLLEALPGWTWEARADRWEDGYNHLKEFVKRQGNARVPSTFVSEDRFKLGVWVVSQRADRKAGTLPSDRVRRLEQLDGWNWDPFEEAWAIGLEYVQQYTKEYGHAVIPAAYEAKDGFRVGAWVNTQRNKHRLGKMPADRRAKLERVRGWVWVAR